MKTAEKQSDSSADRQSDYLGTISHDKKGDQGVFAKDPYSNTLFSEITEPRTKKTISKIVPKIEEYCAKHTSLLGQGSHLSYEDLLMGMFLEDERLVPVRPLMITNYRMCDAETIGWPLEEEKFGLRLFLTNKRCFFLDADLEKIPRLSREKTSGDLLCVDRLMVDFMVIDELFYYPLPLTNVTGLSLDIHYQTVAHGWIEERRAWYSYAFLIAGIIIGAIATLEALFAYGIIPSQSQPEMKVVGGVNDTSYRLPVLDIATGLEMRNFYMLVGGYALILLGPLTYYFWHTYHTSDFKPRMKQRRQILIGALDPVTQKQKAFKLLMDDRYDVAQIRDYLRLLQEYSPHAAGIVLT